MPCYSAWYEYLKEGTPAYRRAKSEVVAKLQAVKHIVDYYYRAAAMEMPRLPVGSRIDPFKSAKSAKERKLRELIAHHFACDGINFIVLYDVCSLLDDRLEADLAYKAIIGNCATTMRQRTNEFDSQR